MGFRIVELDAAGCDMINARTLRAKYVPINQQRTAACIPELFRKQHSLRRTQKIIVK